MLLLIGIILSLIETKEGLKNNKKRLILFIMFIIIITIIYFFKEQIPSIMDIIIQIRKS